MERIVVVKGLTRHGKNRVGNHGHAWKVLRENGNNVLLESMNGKYVCWTTDPITGIEDMKIEGECNV